MGSLCDGCLKERLIKSYRDVNTIRRSLLYRGGNLLIGRCESDCVSSLNCIFTLRKMLRLSGCGITQPSLHISYTSVTVLIVVALFIFALHYIARI